MQLLTIFLIDSAAGAADAPFSMNFIFLGGIIAIFYFFMIRPQQKRSKDERTFREGLSKGDKVLTIGGMHGQIESLDGESALLRVDKDTKIRFDKSALKAMPSAAPEKANK